MTLNKPTETTSYGKICTASGQPVILTLLSLPRGFVSGGSPLTPHQQASRTGNTLPLFPTFKGQIPPIIKFTQGGRPTLPSNREWGPIEEVLNCPQSPSWSADCRYIQPRRGGTDFKLGGTSQ
ncbi:hypothetical protein V490_04728 [Pseudogymnoascus sp. VKM F-3557]|nr:hypothetical protein V490_04728 [Pseudogymnoascus sp. VKM F-3557]